jgi:hypothetical protein
LGGGSSSAVVEVTDMAQIDQSTTSVTTIITDKMINPGHNNSTGGLRLKRSKKPKADEKWQEVLSKLHPSIAALAERLKKKKTTPSADEASFVHDGMAEIQIWLADKSPEIFEQLKQLGFELTLDPKTTKMVAGRIAIERLAALAELKQVHYITPRTTIK